MTLKTRSISIDFAIHQLIETNRTSFEESENEVLRRLLGLPNAPVATPPAAKLRHPSRSNHLRTFLDDPELSPNSLGNGRTSGRSWSYGGVDLPEGTALSLEYSEVKKEACGLVRNGAWEIEGEQFFSPSRAAIALVGRERGGRKKPRSLNGWLCWKVRRPGETEWIALNSLRNSAEIPQRRR